MIVHRKHQVLEKKCRQVVPAGEAGGKLVYQHGAAQAPVGVGDASTSAADAEDADSDSH
jgi:hypothetical protein